MWKRQELGLQWPWAHDFRPPFIKMKSDPPSFPQLGDSTLQEDVAITNALQPMFFVKAVGVGQLETL